MTRDPTPKEAEPHTSLHAGLYALVLINQGLTREEAAARVVARYPHTAPLLRKLTERAPVDVLRNVIELR